MSDRSAAAKVLTIMMTEIVGATTLRRTRGDRDADDMLGLQAAIVRDEVAAFGGRVRKSLGDGFLVSFPSTVPAVRAAAAIQRAMQEHNIANPEHVVEVRVRDQRPHDPELRLLRNARQDLQLVREDRRVAHGGSTPGAARQGRGRLEPLGTRTGDPGWPDGGPPAPGLKPSGTPLNPSEGLARFRTDTAPASV